MNLSADSEWIDVSCRWGPSTVGRLPNIRQQPEAPVTDSAEMDAGGSESASAAWLMRSQQLCSEDASHAAAEEAQTARHVMRQSAPLSHTVIAGARSRPVRPNGEMGSRAIACRVFPCGLTVNVNFIT